MINLAQKYLKGITGKYLSALIVCLISAIAVFWLWGHWGMSGVPPKPLGGDIAQPGGWRRFTVLVLPFLCFVPSIVLFLVQKISPRRHNTWLLAIKRDIRASLAASALWLFIPLAWLELPAPLAYIGFSFIVTLLLKSHSLLGWLWAEFKWNPRQAMATALLFWTLLGSLAIWAEKSITTYSDAIIYLLNAHTIARHGNLKLEISIKNGEYRDFYWARWSKHFNKRADRIGAPTLPFIFAVPYFLAGRLGVLLFHALLLAAAIPLTTSWLIRGTRAGDRSCLLASALVICSAPVIFLSHVEFPDTIGLFLVSLGLWGISHLPEKTWKVLFLQATLLAMVYFIKQRLAISFLGLSAAACIHFIRYKLPNYLLFIAIPAGLAILWYAVPILQGPETKAYWEFNRPYLPVVLHTLSGLYWDQGYGLFPNAPIFFLALAGAPLALKKWPDPGIVAASVIVLSTGLLISLNWWAWHGGFATPFRYLVLTLPVWSVFLLPWLKAERGVLKRTLLYSFVISGGAFTIICTILPVLRPNRPLGASRFWAQLEVWTGLELHHLLPSAFMHGNRAELWGLISLIIAVGLGLWLWLGDRADSDATKQPMQAMKYALAAFFASCIALPSLAYLLPPTIIEAESTKGHKTSNWSPTNSLYMRGKVLLNGSTISRDITIEQGGAYRIQAVFVAQADGFLEVKNNNRVVGEMSFTGTATPKGKRIDPYIAKAFVGRHASATTTVELHSGRNQMEFVYHGPPGRDNWLLLDYIELLSAQR